LLSVQVGLLALVCVAIGLITVLALRHILLDQLDARLRTALNRSRSAQEHPDHTRQPPPGQPDQDEPAFLLAPGQAVGTLGARIAGGTVEAGVLTADGKLRMPPAAAVATLARLPADGAPRTREIAGLGGYRLLVIRAADGDILVTGLPMHDLDHSVTLFALVLAAVTVAGLAVAGLAGAVVVRKALRPLERVAAAARRVVDLPLRRGEVDLAVRVEPADADPSTEVGQVGYALNEMLTHVADALAARQASETRLRQFIADASHELRTPLAAVRGYAELTRRGGEALPTDAVHALGRIEAESARMTVLVEDLLLLARLDAGRPLADAEVDLTLLIVDAVSDARIAGRDQRWRLELPEEPVTVRGDADRLRQVLGNLLANARGHTPAGTTVTVGLVGNEAGAAAAGVAAGTVAKVTVSDDGPGIAPSVVPHIFERFARGESSRTRASGGTGLGLAIVSAVVAAHGGTVEVTSRPGRTVFTVTLPRDRASSPEPEPAPAPEPEPAPARPG
jgi:two-component system OmpR family sensor kinase